MSYYDALGNDVTVKFDLLKLRLEANLKIVANLEKENEKLQKELKKVKKMAKVKLKAKDVTDELQYKTRRKGSREGAPAPKDSASGR